MIDFSRCFNMRIARAPVYRSSQFDTGYSTGEEDVDEDNPCPHMYIDKIRPRYGHI